MAAQCLPRYERRVYHWERNLRAYKVRRAAALVDERAAALYPSFIAALDEQVRKYLPPSIPLRCVGLEKGTPRWDNGFTYVEMSHCKGPNADFIQGRRRIGDDDVPEDADFIEDVCEINMSVVEGVACRDLADWLACDHLDDEGYPAFAPGYVPSWDRWRATEA